ncbi:putative ribosome-associated, YjgA, PSPTO4464-like domain superfamily [Helianthus debilis subsp. tardiflorus]
MAQLLRPLILSPASKHPFRQCINHLSHSKPTHILTGSFTHRRIITTTSSTTLLHRRNLHVSRARGLRPADAPLTSDLSQSDSESDSSDGERKSRNEKKREARRAVRWGMELAEFNDIQIKRILRVVELEEEVFSALMLVKRLGRDVREGKRRQFSYIGRLLRDVEPELMDGLIRATKDGDQQTFQQLSSSANPDLGDTSEEEEEIDYEDEDEGFGDHRDIATRWFDGLVNKDVDITNEIYSLSTVDFDRQELRKLVRNFCSLQVRNATSAENEGEPDKKLLKAKKLLTRFLVSLAKQLPTEEHYML